MKYLLFLILFLVSAAATAQDNCVEIGSSAEYSVSISKTTEGVDTIIWIETDDPHFSIPAGRFTLPMMLSMGSTAIIPLTFAPTEVKTYLANMIFHFSDSATFLAPIDGCGKAASGVADKSLILGLHPNPAAVGSDVRIRIGNDALAQVMVCSALGTEVMRFDDVHGDVVIPTDGLATGGYTCVIISRDRVERVRFVVVR